MVSDQAKIHHLANPAWIPTQSKQHVLQGGLDDALEETIGNSIPSAWKQNRKFKTHPNATAPASKRFSYSVSNRLRPPSQPRTVDRCNVRISDGPMGEWDTRQTSTRPGLGNLWEKTQRFFAWKLDMNHRSFSIHLGHVFNM